MVASYLLGVSTRRMEKLVESLGITLFSKSQVSVMAADFDAQVEAFRTRPLDAVLAVRPVAHVAKELGISRTCAHRWINRYRAHGRLVWRPQLSSQVVPARDFGRTPC